MGIQPYPPYGNIDLNQVKKQTLNPEKDDRQWNQKGDVQCSNNIIAKYIGIGRFRILGGRGGGGARFRISTSCAH